VDDFFHLMQNNGVHFRNMIEGGNIHKDSFGSARDFLMHLLKMTAMISRTAYSKVLN
jgi:hypothetical protein